MRDRARGSERGRRDLRQREGEIELGERTRTRDGGVEMKGRGRCEGQVGNNMRAERGKVQLRI